MAYSEVTELLIMQEISCLNLAQPLRQVLLQEYLLLLMALINIDLSGGVTFEIEIEGTTPGYRI